MGQLSKNIDEGKCQRLMVRHSLIALILTLVASSAAAQNLNLDTCSGTPESPRPLASGGTLTRAMTANELHVYELTLSPDQYMHVVVLQKGIDVIARVRDPSGNLVILRDSPNGKFGPEQVSAIAQSAGAYQVEVCTGRNEPNGAYELTLDGPRAATVADQKRVAAEALLRDGGREFDKGTEVARRTAISLYEQALTIWQELGDSQEKGYALCAIGEVHRYLKELNAATTNLDMALSSLQAANDIAGQAYVRNAMGAAQRDLSLEPARAIPFYEAAITLRQSLADKWGEGHLRNNLGHLYSRLGKNVAALDHYNAALSLWRELGVRDQELNTLNNVATANVELGNASVAFEQFNNLLIACEQDRQLCPEASIRNGLGMIYDIWGQPSEAFEQFNLALQLFESQQGGERGKANVRDNLGMLYAGLNDSQEALVQFQLALTIRTTLTTPGDEATTRSNIGYAQTLLGNRAEALSQLQQALTLSDVSNVRFKGYTLMRLGIVYASSGEKLRALTYYNQALELITSIGDVRGQAIILDRIAELDGSSNEVAAARKHYLEARRRWQEVGDLQGEAEALYGLARLERRQRNLSQARKNIVEAIQKVELLRTSTTNHRLRRTYFEARHDYYALETDIRMQLYFELRAANDLNGAQQELEAALFAAERARARNLLDLLTESRADIRKGVDPQLLDRERRQRNQLSENLELLQNILAQKGEETRKTAVQQQVRSLQRSLDDTQAEIRKQSPRYAALTQPQPLRPNQIKALLDDDTCILQYALADEGSYLWLITRQEILPYVLAPKARIEQAGAALQKAIRIYEPPDASVDKVKRALELRQAEFTFQRRARELTNLILDPVAAKLANKRLVIIADGALQYIPFAALPVPNGSGPTTSSRSNQGFTYLIARHEILYEPSASALGLLRSDSPGRATRSVAVIADPVFSNHDERVKSGVPTDKSEPVPFFEEMLLKRILRDAGDTGSAEGSRLTRLRYSRVEAEAIAAAAPPGSFMEALDFDANRGTMLSEDLKQFRIIHIATHGVLNPAYPELSGLVFSLVDKQGQRRPGFLRLSDIYNLNLNADLVVLSACQSGIGEQLKSEGMLGLTRGFMYAGAERVVATLWKVDDIATSELMKRFYTHILSGGKPASVALRQAQLDMLASGDKSLPPFYWAGFVLQGEWK